MFFEGGADSFSDMAKAYRAHLIENRGLKPLKARTASNPILDYASKSQWLKIFCADKPPQYDGKGEYKVWTSFEEARTILSELKKRGIDKITCMLVGWGPEGHDGRLPDRLPPDDRLGGEAKMKELVNWGLKQGFQMVVHDTYTSSYIRASTFHDDEIMRNAYGFFRIGGVWGGGEEKCLKPEVALKYAKRDLRKIRDEIGLCGCYYLDAISLGLESDFTKDGVNPRSHYANGLLALIDYTKEIFGACQVENSLDYIFDSADATASVITDPYRIKNLDCNISRCVDMFLPFFQIAWHGIILYHHADLMQFVDKTGESPFKAILQEISWGALGRIEMTYNDSFACKGFLCINDKEILDKVGLQFDLLNKKAGYLQKEFIEDYHQIAGNAFLTTFSDGSKVFVDYGNLSCRIINGQGKVIADVCYCHIPEYVS